MQKLNVSDQKSILAINSALRREIQIGEFLLDKYKRELTRFEKKYNLGTNEFLEKFESGKLGDKEYLFEWFALYKAKSYWKEKLKILKEFQ